MLLGKKEGACEVSHPFDATQPGLGLRGVRSPKGVENRDTCTPRDPTGDLEGLIGGALMLTAPMKGNRDEEGGRLFPFLVIENGSEPGVGGEHLNQEVSKGGCKVELPLVLNGMDELAAFWLKDEGCAGEVKVEVQVSAVLARKGGSEVTVVGLSAVLAERSLNSNQAGRAVRAEALTVSEADLAELTAGRVEKVEKTGE